MATVVLVPDPVFCIKSTALNDAAHIPAGSKVFVNVASDTHVPSPPHGTIKHIALASDAESVLRIHVPLVLSSPRPDIDKAGKPSVVFDAIFHPSIKSPALRSLPFKTYLIDLTFRQIHAQHSLLLSPHIRTPNILSKGRLSPRSVLIADLLSSPAAATITNDALPLIQELPTPSIPSVPNPISPASPASLNPAPLVPELTWSTTDQGALRIALSVPALTRASIPHASLDIEPRRLIFTAPSPLTPDAGLNPGHGYGYALDLDLDLPPTSIRALFSSLPSSSHASSSKSAQSHSAEQALALARERPLDLVRARAEWRPAEDVLTIYA